MTTSSLYDFGRRCHHPAFGKDWRCLSCGYQRNIPPRPVDWAKVYAAMDKK